jgi:hypothetical protein
MCHPAEGPKCYCLDGLPLGEECPETRVDWWDVNAKKWRKARLELGLALVVVYVGESEFEALEHHRFRWAK